MITIMIVWLAIIFFALTTFLLLLTGSFVWEEIEDTPIGDFILKKMKGEREQE